MIELKSVLVSWTMLTDSSSQVIRGNSVVMLEVWSGFVVSNLLRSFADILRHLGVGADWRGEGEMIAERDCGHLPGFLPTILKC